MPQTMTKRHPKWDEFCKRLAGPEGVGFVPGKWTCNGSSQRPYAVAILKTYEDIDIPATLDYFKRNGGHCDCEILYQLGTRPERER